MSDTRVGRASDLFGKVRCELHPKQARYQASLQPEPQEQRLDSSTRTSATFRDSRASRLAGASEGPCVTKTLPSYHKLAENTRQTCQGPRFDGRAIGSATTSDRKSTRLNSSHANISY